jgi:hypothetical protein
MMTSDKSAYRGTLRAFLVVFVVILVAGFIGDFVTGRRGNFEKAEGFIADMHAMATEVPRLADGSIVRQGPISTAWMDDAGALPVRLQAMAGTLRGAENQRTLGLVMRGPWSFTIPVETKDSLILTQLLGVPKAVCEQLGRAIAKHPDQVAYVSASGDPPIIPLLLSPTRLCDSRFNNSVLITLDPPTEVRRLSADIQNAIRALPANLTDKVYFPGKSAPFQVYRGQDGGPGFIERDQSGIRVTINNVPLSVCTLALLVGPKGFGMDAFVAPDGKAVMPGARPAFEALCNDLGGRLILTRP